MLVPHLVSEEVVLRRSPDPGWAGTGDISCLSAVVILALHPVLKRAHFQ